MTRSPRPLPDGVELREPTPADAPAWATFLVEAQQATYAGRLPEDFGVQGLAQANVEGLARAFGDPARHDAVRRIAWAGDAIVGVAATSAAPARWEVELGLVPPPAGRELDRLYVHADMHGTGLGAALFDAVVDDRAHYLWLIDGNERAARFYERRGFEHLDERVSTGPTWGGIPMHRMLRPERSTAG
ncbi:GNAT family N-acetyltransferase [Agrococcus carbonis]|uniref:Ribosomal protein S18 acetylase RimI n=1 Tax=Agrococcus carbonis TaxID=684552 RepID=A0A1H1LHH7_9MICO|nr:GNAT family N-acetyltransferase [Agrococcus carbonis]SDR73485.1 Ribosomal protein S18 acetylase RimI [Agrococcus carbonis]